MKIKTGLLTALAFGWLCLGLATTSQAGLTLKYNPANLAQTGPGPFQVDVLVNWDGIGANSLSTVDFDVTVPAGVRLLDNPTPPNPLNFQFASVDTGAVSFVNFAGDVAPFADGVDTRLTTLSFEVTPMEGTFPLGITVSGASRGVFGAEDITDQVSSLPGDLVVTVAVPEPSSFALLGVASLAGFGWRRRRS